GRQQRGYRHGGVEAPAVLGGEHRGGVDAHAHEGALAEAEVAAVAGEDVPAGGLGDPEEHGVEQGEVEQGHPQLVAEDRQRAQAHQHQREADQPPADHRATSCGRRRRSEGRRSAVPPVNSPWGRSSSASTIARNTTSSVAVSDHSTEVTPYSVPTSRPAARLPSTCPMPPRITTANTMPIHS